LTYDFKEGEATIENENHYGGFLNRLILLKHIFFSLACTEEPNTVILQIINYFAFCLPLSTGKFDSGYYNI